MFNTIKNMLQNKPAAQKNEREHDIALAVTAMMIEIMRADDQLQDVEHNTIIQAIQQRFGLAGDAVNQLIQDAKAAQDQATDFHQFTTIIHNHLNTEQRIDFLKELWQIAMVDGAIDPDEEQLIRRIAGLIGVYHGEFIGAKIQAREQLLKP